ncbi:MAG: hypothetical protein WEC39_01505, partial [Patescibacteria group bacterium]
AIINFPYGFLANVPLYYRAYPDSTLLEGTSEEVQLGVFSHFNTSIAGQTEVEVSFEEEDVTMELEIIGDNEIWPTIPVHGVQSAFDLNIIENSTEFIITVESGGEPKSNQLVEITAEWKQDSGGHSHNGSKALKTPPPELMGMFTNLSTEESSQGFISVITDSTGIVRLNFESPEFGGEVELTARITDGEETILSSQLLTMQVPDLMLLPDAPHIYKKVGGVPNHHGPRLDNRHSDHRTPDNNHWVNETVGQLLIALAVIYNEQFPDWEKIRYNDISLPNGGRFNIDGEWSGNRNHALHRLGFNVDVRTSPPREDGIPLEDLEEIQRIIELLDPNAVIDVHGSRFIDSKTGNLVDSRHFHIDFRIFQVLQP